jgi:hypothetical protein
MMPARTWLRRLQQGEAPFALSLGAAALLFLLLGSLGAVTDPWRGDESFTYWITSLPTSEMMQHIVPDVHPPLFYLVMAAWRRLWFAPGAMKVLTLLFGLSAVIMAGVIGRQLAGRRAGVLAALLFATFPMFLHYAQDARMYGLALLFEMVAVEGWMLAVRRPRAGWVLFTFGMVAANYTHNHCLVFSAFFLTAETVRCAARRRPGGTGWRWIVSAWAVVGALYTPWVPVLLRQMGNPYLKHVYNAPTWSGALRVLFFDAYALHPPRWANAQAWMLGIGLLGLVPAVAVLGAGHGRMVDAAASRPPWVLYVTVLGPFVFLWCFSRWREPVLEMSRHGVLFIPLLLLPAAAWVGRPGDGARPRWVTDVLVALLTVNAFAALKSARDPDIRRAADVILDKALIGAPLYSFPMSPDRYHLDFLPLPMAVVPSFDMFPNHLTSCTLLVAPGAGPQHQILADRARVLLAQASEVRPIYTSYYLMTYALQGLPDGAVRRFFLWQERGWTMPIWAGALGDRPVERSWDLAALAAAGRVPLRPVALGLNEYGLRLDAATSEWEFTLPQESPGSFLALWMSGQAVNLTGPTPVETRLTGAPRQIIQIEPGRFSLSSLLPPTLDFITVRLGLPPTVAQAVSAPIGDVPAGIYLIGACCVRLTPADLQRPDRAGLFIDIGALGDELFLRSTIHEREGIPASNARWTYQEFALEVPVWEPGAGRAITLWGHLPPEISNRTIQLSVTRADPALAPLTATTEGPSSYGAARFELSEPLEPGIHRLTVRLGGVFIPAEHGENQDRRRLGFLLDGVEIDPSDPAAPARH